MKRWIVFRFPYDIAAGGGVVHRTQNNVVFFYGITPRFFTFGQQWEIFGPVDAGVLRWGIDAMPHAPVFYGFRRDKMKNEAGSVAPASFFKAGGYRATTNFPVAPPSAR